MCTVMQKDVLIEMIANTMATINVRTEPNAENNDDQNYLMNLRNDLYSTHHDNIDYHFLSMMVKNIKDKYIGLPVHKYYA
ncbi:hypothetical protein ACFGWE_10750 [Pasteurella multocida]|uniref:hypothetical protein n=1 Tax=Pasteurella multocida TaxID=747 RepID=UPI0009F6F02E|nr:hypothetical protein [Pasteurella multocida]MEB3502325.1 hypothetical protein [Pasteurella multocida]PNM06757.1 hypothetical protein A6J89_000040 [Pasteurella multocida]